MIRIKPFLASLAIVACTLAVYLPLATYPFVQDDWQLLRQLQHGVWQTIAAAFSPTRNFFFRPFGVAWFGLLFQLFGLVAPWYHIAAIALHAANCLLVAAVARRLSGEPAVGFTTAVVYGTAVTVHLMPLVWIVGIYELLSVTFGLLALLALMDDRPALSGALFAGALCTKEAALAIIVPLAAWQVLFATGTPAYRMTALRIHAVAIAGYTLVKLAAPATAGATPSDPYFLTFAPDVLVNGIVLYATWSAHALAPIEGHARLLAIPGALVMAASVWLVLRLDPAARVHVARVLAFAAAWTAGALAPILGLPNHRYAYYLTHAWVPLSFAAVLLIWIVARHLAASRRTATAAMIAWSVIAVVSNAIAYREMREGRNVVPIAMSSQLITQLPAVFPAMPHNAVIVFADGIQIGGLGQHAAARVLYDDDTLYVYSIDQVRCENGMLAAVDNRDGTFRTLYDDVIWLGLENDRLSRTPAAMTCPSR